MFFHVRVDGGIDLEHEGSVVDALGNEVNRNTG